MNQTNSSIEEIVDDFITRFSVNIADVKTTKELAKYWIRKTLLELNETHHQELQKARESERERIEAIFKEHVPPHAMDLEDSVWLKRLLNKAFQHENIY